MIRWLLRLLGFGAEHRPRALMLSLPPAEPAEDFSALDAKLDRMIELENEREWFRQQNRLAALRPDRRCFYCGASQQERAIVGFDSAAKACRRCVGLS